MKLLVFEYSSISLYDNLLSEGINMLKGVLNDLKDSSFEVYCLINRNINSIEYDNIHAIYLDDNLFEWLEKNSKKFDYCLFIAPEDNLIQFHIARILEDNGVKIIGCDSKSSYICSSKNLTYGNVPSNVLKIKSFKCKSDKITYEMIMDKLNKTPFIIKPDDRTSSDLIFVIDNKNMCEKVRDVYVKNNIEHLLVQEYVEGTPISVSLVCNDKNMTMISVNSQEIAENNNIIVYMGCKTPIEHALEKQLDEISRSIVQSIPGLKGFVGIDYIVQEKKIFFVEINSRITTPYIVLQKNCRQNLTCSIIDYVIAEKDTISLTFERQGKFIR